MNKIRSVLGNGLPFGIIFFGLGCMLGYIFRVSLRETLIIAAATGLAALLANGVLYRRFSRSSKTLDAITLAPQSGEALLLQAPANYSDEVHPGPGKLFLTDQRLVFVPYAANGQQAQQHWHLAQLSPQAFHRSLWNAGGTFILNTTDGIQLVFEVNNLKHWKEAMQPVIPVAGHTT